MSSYLPEANLLSVYLREHSGNTLAEADFFTLHPEHRLSLEGLTQGSEGKYFEEIEDVFGLETLPAHIRGERKFYMRYIRNAAIVQELLEAIARIYDSPGYTSEKGLRAARCWFVKRLGEFEKETGDKPNGKEPLIAVEAMTDYFIGLADSLSEVSMKEEEDIALELELCHGGGTTRHILRHKPNGDIEKDWILRQSVPFRSVLFNLRKCNDYDKLIKYCHVIRRYVESRVYNGIQTHIIWGCYFARKEYLESKPKGKMCRRLLDRIENWEGKGFWRVGACLYNWSQGHKYEGKEMPDKMNSMEWALVWKAYKKKKEDVS